MLLASTNKAELIQSVKNASNQLLIRVIYTQRPCKVSSKLLRKEITEYFGKSDHLYVVEYDETKYRISEKQHLKNCKRLIKEIKEL